MRQEIREALEAARNVEIKTDGRIGPPRRRSFQAVRAVVLAVVQELPEDISIAELRDELQISNNQGEHE